MTLREVVHAHIPFLDQRSTIRDAIDKMDIYQFTALVVVDDEQAPIGVLTEGDLCRAASARGSVVGMADEPAHLYATREPTCAAIDCEISDAYHQMLMSGLTILPVVEFSKLMGMVLRVDLMQAMLQDVQPERV